MSSFERVKNTLEHKPVDRLAAVMFPWESTLKRWRSEGHIGKDEDVYEHFECDIRAAGWCNTVANIDHTDVVLEETAETILVRDGNGATLRRHKLHESTPEHVDFAVKDMASWQEIVRPHLLRLDQRRLAIAEYTTIRDSAKKNGRFFCWHAAGPFELMHLISGHEGMLMGMALEPEWVKDMVLTYAKFTIDLGEELFARGGRPDAVFFYEDMGYKFKPFMSPAMYADIMQPGHRMLFDFAHSKGCKVLLHSCGFVEPLVDGLIEAGMDCLTAMEVKAGMDMPELFKKYGDKIAFYGGFDARALISNDRKQIDEEMRRAVVPVVEGGGAYILHSDHSEPPDVDYETMRYFFDSGRAIKCTK